MIYDRLDQMHLYSLGENNLSRALRAILKQPMGQNMKEEGFKLNYNVFTTQVVKEGRFEAHRKQIDIHIVLRGKEYVEVTHVDHLVHCTDYDEEQDYLLGDKSEGREAAFTLSEGFFMICFPHDAHKVGRHLDQPNEVEKLVLKIDDL